MSKLLAAALKLPYVMKTQTGIQCKFCTTPLTIPVRKRCPHCMKQKSKHPKYKAFQKHVRIGKHHHQPYQPDFDTWLRNPFMPPNTKHPRADELTILNLTTYQDAPLTMAELTNFTPPSSDMAPPNSPWHTTPTALDFLSWSKTQ